MPSLIETLKPLLGTQTARLAITIEPASGGQFALTITPLVGAVDEKAPEELKQLKAALSMPFKLVNTPEALEAELVDHIERFQTPRVDWETRAATLSAAISQAAANDTKSAQTKPPSPSPSPKAQQAKTTQNASTPEQTKAEPTPADQGADDDSGFGFV